LISARRCIGPIGTGRKTELAQHNFHGLPRPQQWTCHAIERTADAGEGPRQHFAVARCMGTTRRVERNVLLPLIALGEVPIGFAMTGEIERQPWRHHAYTRTSSR
jgi:hypothetical protein